MWCDWYNWYNTINTIRSIQYYTINMIQLIWYDMIQYDAIRYNQYVTINPIQSIRYYTIDTIQYNRLFTSIMNDIALNNVNKVSFLFFVLIWLNLFCHVVCSMEWFLHGCVFIANTTLWMRKWTIVMPGHHNSFIFKTQCWLSRKHIFVSGVPWDKPMLLVYW